MNGGLLHTIQKVRISGWLTDVIYKENRDFLLVSSYVKGEKISASP